MNVLITAIVGALMILSLTLPSHAQERPTRQTRAYVLGKLKQHDLVFMGTTHKQPPILALIADLLPRLHSAGVSHLALEVAGDQQGRIDRYLTTGKGLKNIVLHQAIDCPAYRRLLEILHRLPDKQRPRVLAIDLPPALYGGPTRRDEFMAMSLAQSLKSQSGVKILAVLGSLHVLRKLAWQPRITHGHDAIRTQLSQWRPDLRMFSMVHIAESANMQSDFYRLAPLTGTTALDLDHRHKDWRLGITDSMALRPSQPYELVDGVIVH